MTLKLIYTYIQIYYNEAKRKEMIKEVSHEKNSSFNLCDGGINVVLCHNNLGSR